MIKLGLIGYPLSHSMSSIMHEKAFESLKIDGSYVLLETEPCDIVERVKMLKVKGYQGFNVTIPLKVPITMFLEQVDDYANLAGAVNTVKVMPDKSLYGYNTDIYGFVKAIPQAMAGNLKGKKALVLGAGGAARAVGVGLSLLESSDIDFYSRTYQSTKDLSDFISSKFEGINSKVIKIDNSTDLSEYSIVVNTTPLGMDGANISKTPLSESNIMSLNEDAIVYDIVYNPIETKLLKMAEARNLYTINGLDMFVHQGAKAFNIWTGKTAPVDVMKKAVLEKLNNG